MLFGLAYESPALYQQGASLIFGLIESISVFIFIYNIWKSMGNSSK